MAAATLTLLLVPPVPRAAAEELLHREQHAWGKFQPGSWSRVRLVTQSMGANGQVHEETVSHTTTTLESVTEQRVTLRVESVVEVGGRVFEARPQVVTKNWLGRAHASVSVEDAEEDEVLMIGGQSLPTAIYPVTAHDEAMQCEHRLWFHGQQWPYILKREWECRSPENNELLFHARMDTLSLAMPYQVLGETRNVAHVQTVQTWPNGRRMVTIEVHCPDVPGGLVSHTMKQTDKRGHVVRRSVLELVGYQIVMPDAPPAGSEPSGTRQTGARESQSEANGAAEPSEPNSAAAPADRSAAGRDPQRRFSWRRRRPPQRRMAVAVATEPAALRDATKARCQSGRIGP